MKANGRNYKMFMYESHAYMDMYPEKHLATYATQDDVDKFIAHMRDMWCSGTMSDAKGLTPMELFEQRQSRYWRGCEESIDGAALDCTQDFVDEYYFYVEHKDYDIAALRTAWEDYCHTEDIIADYCSREY